MFELKNIRKPLAALAAATAVSAAVALPASPASAAPVTRFAHGAIAGTITWTSSRSYSVTATIYGSYNNAGFSTQGYYFDPNSARISCGYTAHRSNPSTEVPRTATASTECGRANIQQVRIWYTINGGAADGVAYLDNPRA